MTTTAIIRELEEAARLLQKQTGHLLYQLHQSPIDLVLVVQTLSVIEDTARDTLTTFHVHAKDTAHD